MWIFKASNGKLSSSVQKKFLFLWEQAFGRKMSSHLLKWKYQLPPFGAQMMLAYDMEGNLCGHFGGQVFEALWQGKTYLITHLTDAMIHPAWQKKGLYPELVKKFFLYFAENSQFFYGYPGLYHFKVGKKRGFFRPFNQGVAYFESTSSISKKKFLRRYFYSFRALEVRDLKQVSECCKKLSYYMPILKRSKEFLFWRFMRHPENTYFMYGLFSFSGKLKGFVSVKKNKEELIIVDLVPSLEEEETDILLQETLNLFPYKRYQLWISKNILYFVKIKYLKSYLEPLGIYPCAVSHPYVEDKLMSWREMFYTMADADIF